MGRLTRTRRTAISTLTALAFVGGGVIASGAGTAGAARPPATMVTNCSGDATAIGSLPLVVANSAPGGSIRFSVTCDASNPIIVSNTMTIWQDLRIEGSGVANTVISGGGTSQIFQIANGATVSISAMTIENGNSVNGGAIDVGDASSGTLNVKGCTFSNNMALQAGGAIDSGDDGGSGAVTVTDSTFSGNSVSYYDGGAIDSGDDGGTGVLTISGSTFSLNAAPTGGAIDNGDFGGSGTMEVSNSTFSENTASGPGGAIHNIGPSTITASTFFGNGAATGGSILATSRSLTVAASVFAGATSGGECNSTTADGGYNISDDGSCAFSGTGSVNSSSTLDASLGVLADNGGPTQTILPDSTSPLIGAIPVGTTLGITSACPTTDQRGIASGGACAIGSVQVGLTVPTTPTISNIPISTPVGASFTPQVTTDSDGTTSVTSSTPTTCTVGTTGNVAFRAYGNCTLTPSVAASATYAASTGAPSSFVVQLTPALHWTKPKPFTYGTPLSPLQLDAGASVLGIFVYSPPNGTVLSAGSHTMTATFYPWDSTSYASASISTTMTVKVASSTTTLALSSSSIAFSAETAETFTVSSHTSTGVPNSGPINVMAGKVLQCVAVLDSTGTGTCSLNDTQLRPGRYAIKATTMGNSNVKRSLSASRSLTVTG